MSYYVGHRFFYFLLCTTRTTLYDLGCTLETTLSCGFLSFVRLYDHFRKSLYAREIIYIN